MFRRLADNFNTAVFGNGGGDGVEHLMAMGFHRDQAVQALQATNGNVDEAAELLLASTTPNPPVNNHHNRSDNNADDDDDDDLRRALKASLEITSARPNRTAAMEKASRAAQARHKNGGGGGGTKVVVTAQEALAARGVKVTPKLQEKTVPEQILRCADRVKAFPNAVDTLFKICSMIQKNPQEMKYRTIDTTTAAFRRSLESVPGAMDFLKALNFQSLHDNGKLYLTTVDPALFYLAISALEQTKLTLEYQQAKQKLLFDAELQHLLAQADSSEVEAIQRAAFLAKCPTEPPPGRGALIHVALGDALLLQRRFDSDDTLQDVLCWLAGHASAIYDKLTISRDYMLVDLHRFPEQPLDCLQHANATLQYLGWWPSGKLELRPSTPEWKQEPSQNHHVKGSIRGLGAASKDVL